MSVNVVVLNPEMQNCVEIPSYFNINCSELEYHTVLVLILHINIFLLLLNWSLTCLFELQWWVMSVGILESFSRTMELKYIFLLTIYNY